MGFPKSSILLAGMISFLMSFVFPAAALEKPLLLSATAQSDSSILLSWRNNDANSIGFIIQRRDSTAVAYQIIDSVKSASQLTYLDIRGIEPATRYYYQVRAFSASTVSDTSNSLQATSLNSVLFAPRSRCDWNFDTSYSVRITILDSSTREQGYRIYRDSMFTGYKLIAQLESANPSARGAITYFDKTISNNTWYRYTAAVYNSHDSISGVPCSTYTFRSLRPNQIVKFTKLGTFPISDSGGWAARSGDSIILKESNAPAGSYTVINVHNPSTPVFAGYTDSATLVTYPLSTMIPAYLKLRVKNGYGPNGLSPLIYGDKILVANNNRSSSPSIWLYGFSGGNFSTIAGQGLTGTSFTPSITSLLALDDSTAGVLFSVQAGVSESYTYYSFFKISSSAIDTTLYRLAGTSGVGYHKLFVRGKAGINSLIIDSAYGFYSAHTSWIFNTSLHKICVDSGLIIPRKIASNSGYNFSSDIFLSMDSSYLYAESPQDLNGFQTALANGAVLPDSIKTRQHVLIDTAGKRLYILYRNTMVIYSYVPVTVGVRRGAVAATPVRAGIRVIPGPAGSFYTILLPRSAPATLFFHDLRGRVIDKLTTTHSNAVIWKPKASSTGCLIISAVIEGQKYSAKLLR